MQAQNLFKLGVVVHLHWNLDRLRVDLREPPQILLEIALPASHQESYAAKQDVRLQRLRQTRPVRVRVLIQPVQEEEEGRPLCDGSCKQTGHPRAPVPVRQGRVGVLLEGIGEKFLDATNRDVVVLSECTGRNH